MVHLCTTCEPLLVHGEGELDMGKVSRTVRLDQADADRVAALKAGEESMNAAYVRVIEAGLDDLEQVEEEDHGEPGQADADGAGASWEREREALLANIDDLREHIRTLDDQLDQKDRQLDALALTAQAAAGTASTALARRGPIARLMDRIHRDR